MSERKFPVMEVPGFMSENTKYDTTYRRSIKWDPAAGDFVRDGANMENPRTEDVRDFVFSHDGDSMHCTFKVNGVNFDEEITITI